MRVHAYAKDWSERAITGETHASPRARSSRSSNSEGFALHRWCGGRRCDVSTRRHRFSPEWIRIRSRLCVSRRIDGRGCARRRCAVRSLLHRGARFLLVGAKDAGLLRRLVCLDRRHTTRDEGPRGATSADEDQRAEDVHQDIRLAGVVAALAARLDQEATKADTSTSSARHHERLVKETLAPNLNMCARLETNSKGSELNHAGEHHGRQREERHDAKPS